MGFNPGNCPGNWERKCRQLLIGASVDMWRKILHSVFQRREMLPLIKEELTSVCSEGSGESAEA